MHQWLRPSLVGNGILWILGAAMQIGGWVNQAIAITLLVIAFLWSGTYFIYWMVNHGKQTKKEALTEAKTEPKLIIGVTVKKIEQYDYYARAESRGGKEGDKKITLDALISPSKSTRLDALYLEIHGKRFNSPVPNDSIIKPTHFVFYFEIPKEDAINTNEGTLYAEAYGKPWPSEPFPVNFGGNND